MVSANSNGGPYLYGRWRTLWSKVNEDWGRVWNVRLDAGRYDWKLAHGWLSRLQELPRDVAEAEIRIGVYSMLVGLFPELRYPDIAVEYRLGSGHADIYCRGTVFEIKKRGNLGGKGSGPPESQETPEEQALRYLKPLADKFSDCEEYIPRCCVTDGSEWRFYYYNRQNGNLLPDEMLHYPMNPRQIGGPDYDYVFDYIYDVDDVGLLYKLHSFVSGKEWGEFILW